MKNHASWANLEISTAVLSSSNISIEHNTKANPDFLFGNCQGISYTSLEILQRF